MADVYRLRVRLAADLPWSDYVSSAPLELLLNAVRRAQDNGMQRIRLEVRHDHPDCTVEDWRIVVDFDAGDATW